MVYIFLELLTIFFSLRILWWFAARGWQCKAQPYSWLLCLPGSVSNLIQNIVIKNKMSSLIQCSPNTIQLSSNLGCCVSLGQYQPFIVQLFALFKTDAIFDLILVLFAIHLLSNLVVSLVHYQILIIQPTTSFKTEICLDSTSVSQPSSDPLHHSKQKYTILGPTLTVLSNPGEAAYGGSRR